jgi:hypothetical protein
MEQKYLTILYNIHNIVHVIRTGHILRIPEIKPKIINYNIL